MKTFNLKTLLKSLPWGTLLLVLSVPVKSQSALDQYLREGLDRNLVLQQKNFSYQQAEKSLQIARTYFLPSISLLADYTSGEGGRSIAVPIGDLLNPVYASLNQLTQSDNFPQVQNVEQNFFPKNFYDARVRTTLPLINTDLYVNRTIQGQQVLLKQYELDAYKRELVLDIKTAYFQYLSSLAAIKIYESALELVNKNVQLNESLLKNGKSLPSQYLRSKSEAERVVAELNNARNQAANAQKYFNFLLNKPLDSIIDTQYVVQNDLSLTDTASVTADHREELKMLQQAELISESSLKLNRLSRAPKVNAFLDLGSQASDWKYTDNSRYYLVGVQFSVPLFQGFRNNLSIKQSKLGVQQAVANKTYASQQLQLAAEIAKNNVSTSVQNFQASREQLKSAQSYFTLVEKGYQQGVNTLLEFLDARNQLTASQLQQNLKMFDVLTTTARLERETATYEFQK